MDMDDVRQYGRLEVFNALNAYDKNHESHASESTFVRRHLKNRFYNLLRASIGRTSTLGKSAIVRKKNAEHDYKNIVEVSLSEGDFDDSLNFRSDLNLDNIDEIIDIKNAINSLVEKDRIFNNNYRKYKFYGDKLNQMNKEQNINGNEYRFAQINFNRAEAKMLKFIRKEVNRR